MATGTDSATPKLHRITGVEIFRAGDYGEKGRYGVEDLDTIAASYDPAKHSAALKFDHIDQGPAAGWISRVYRSGEKLLVDVVNATKDAADGFLGAWKNRSAEIYRDFEGSGKPYLRGLALLGSAAPHVKGLAHVTEDQIAAMKDAGERFITLSGDASGAFAFYDYGMEASEGYETPAVAEMPIPYVAQPYGSPAGMNATVTRSIVIVDSEATGETRGHNHVADLSRRADGWTSPPCYMGPNVPGDDHQHVIERGKVLPAADKLGIMHTHELELEAEDYDLSISIEAPEAMTMSDTNKQNEAEAAKFSELETRLTESIKAEFAEKLATLEASNKTLTEQAEAAKRKARDVSFDSAWEKAENEGRVVPAQKPKELALFNALCDSHGGVVNFGESAELAPADAFLSALSERPVMGIAEKDIAGKASGEKVAAITFGDAGDADQVAANRRTAEINKFKADNNIKTFTEAALAWSKATGK